MSDITQSLSARANLLSLKTTQSLLDRTSNRLGTQKKVDKPIDDARAYFASESLLRVSKNYSIGQSNIQQASNTIDTAIAALKSITKYVEQMQGLLTTLSTATTAAESGDLANQYNQLINQINILASSATYQGVNLIGATATTLNLSFRGVPGVNDLAITSVRSDAAGLTLASFATGLFFNQTITVPALASRQSIASFQSIASRESRAAINSSPAQAVTGSVASIPSTASMESVASRPPQSTAPTAQGTPSQASVASAASIESVASRESVAAIASSAPAVAAAPSIQSIDSMPSVDSVASRSANVVGVNSALITALGTNIGNALATLGARQSTLGSTNAILAVRLEFSQSYVAIQQLGSAQLTTADLNEESANLAALQTAQSLGIVSLSVTNQAQQGLLRLF